MEEVDKIIIHSLREIGCDLDEEVQCLRQLNTDQVVEAVVRCLTVILPGHGIPHTLPPSMSARFRIGTSIADVCTELGYTGDVGYQTFLYSNEADVRKVFMFLIEKLPKDTDKGVVQPEDTSSSLRLSIAEAVRKEIHRPWQKSYSQQKSFLSVPLETGITLPGQKRDCTPQEWREYCVRKLPFLHCQPSNQDYLLPSVIAANTQKLLSLKPSPPLSVATSTPCFGAANQSFVTEPSSWLSVASKLLYVKEERVPRPAVITQQEENEDEESKKKAESERIDRLRERLEELQTNIKTINSKLAQVIEEGSKEAEIVKEREREADIRQRTLDLLPDSAANMAKLQALLDATSEKLVTLASQWEKHRLPLIQRYREARRNFSSKANESVRQLESAREAREKLREIQEQITSKESLQTRLQDEFSKVDKTINRTAYTRRILEIIGNIKKQKEDINKVVEDTKTLQKDINMLTGRLDRSFTVADELIFRDAKKDESARKAYKLLATLQADCNQLVAMVEETGAIVREIRDLEEQIEIESAKNVGANLERISSDLRQMKQESAALTAQLRQANIL